MEGDSKDGKEPRKRKGRNVYGLGLLWAIA
jgi:hypothetical protein